MVYTVPYMEAQKWRAIMKKRDLRNDWALFSHITGYIKPYLGYSILATVALAGNLVLLLFTPIFN